MNAKKILKNGRAAIPVKNISAPATTIAILFMTAGKKNHHQPARIPPQWARAHQRLVALRESIFKMHGDHALVARQPLEGFSMDMADAATDEFDHNLTLSGLSASQNVLYEIDEALKRIEHGSYGICEVSGKPIPRARLEAVPWARYVREVAEQFERMGNVGRPQLGELRSAAAMAPENTET